MIRLEQRDYNKLNPKSYAIEKRRLQVELLKLQEDVIKNKRKICICFEGRDGAGKSSTIKFFSEYLIPKSIKYVHLGVPTKWESSHWLQRWEKALPKKGEIAFLDRSWYTRALIEPVMGYCTEKQYRKFMDEIVPWEQDLISRGMEVVKFYFSISKDQQKIRFNARKSSDLKYWKFSENDSRVIDRFDSFTLYKEQMFEKTSHELSPWIVINANNKMIARLSALRYLLNRIEYQDKKLLKPVKWSSNLNNFSLSIDGVLFDQLSYEQYQAISKYAEVE